METKSNTADFSKILLKGSNTINAKTTIKNIIMRFKYWLLNNKQDMQRRIAMIKTLEWHDKEKYVAIGSDIVLVFPKSKEIKKHNNSIKIKKT